MDTRSKEVIVIKPTKAQSKEDRLRVAAYCRVSTDSSDQLNSFFAQMKYYTDYIRSHDNMVLVDIYADEGITGTSIQKREEFKRLIRDCKNKRIDRVLVKSVTRFARNSLECIETVRQLKSCGVSVFFENDNIDTDKMNSEMILYIKSAFAQGEAMSASKRMTTSVRMKMESGTYVTPTAPFGYRLVDGVLVVEPTEAEIVKHIFKMYLDGFGKVNIVSHLKETHPEYEWNVEGVHYILTNEKYIGDSLWQKYYTPHELPLKTRRNHGEVPKYYCKDTHEAIIDKTTFEKVRVFMQTKREKFFSAESAIKQNVFDWNIKCRCCGWKFRSKKQKCDVTWICSRKGTQKEVCKTRTYTNRELERAFVSVYNTFRQNERLLLGETISMLQTLKAKVNAGNDEIGEIDRKIAELTAKNSMYTNLYSSGVIDELVYFEKVDQIKDSITELRSRRLRLINEDENEACIEKLRKLKRILEESPESITAFDKGLFQKIVEKVYAEVDGALTFELLGGLELKKAVGA